MPKVVLNKGKKTMPFEAALRKFNKLVDEANIMQEVRKREYFEKPAQKRVRKKKEAIKRQQRLNSDSVINARNNRKY